MLPAIIAGLVKDQSPDHVPHTQEFIEVDTVDPTQRTIRVMCSCTVGLTLKLPPPESVKAKPQKVEVSDGT